MRHQGDRQCGKWLTLRGSNGPHFLNSPTARSSESLRLQSPLWSPRPQLWMAPSLPTTSQGSFSHTCHHFRGTSQYHQQLPPPEARGSASLTPSVVHSGSLLSAFFTVLPGHSRQTTRQLLYTRFPVEYNLHASQPVLSTRMWQQTRVGVPR